ncbi:ABC transporter permease [Paenibacillus macquariensis]|uniref:Aldouronate transport system permease protein n=1 Tax=Paenibacillus macquariensis TaxID=948756 RepID=A0ABY1KB18_9BACL|nr:ABC transporter permease subunit [Paenibacillus macquariensis]MEC0089531.1 ABC transporter permease subunit [Paenibacillus macquariensis]OAB25798.1 sugar ABC transporter permease [Paenibacillus macquariensis subsp. macquariensis]SIR53335.1 putative aldouronate transport system permease protein [Paenibacillus macquariensis]
METITIKPKTKKVRRRVPFFSEIIKNKTFYAMMLPGLLFIIVIYYLPMMGVVIAFQQYNPFKGILGSPWVGFKNFEFLFKSDALFQITFNTIFYNVIFLILGIGLALVFAILIDSNGNRFLSGAYKSILLLPYLLSWVVAEYLLFSFLSVDRGILNQMLHFFGIEPISWYSEPIYWRFILPAAYVWKNVGYFAVIFAAGISGISTEYYEAAKMDGANKFQQAIKITIPMLMPITIILILLQVGKIFYAAFGDWGMFYNLPKDSGILFSATNVIDTYVYRSLKVMGDFGMSSAVGLYQSVVGFVLVLISNFFIRRYDKDSALF